MSPERPNAFLQMSTIPQLTPTQENIYLSYTISLQLGELLYLSTCRSLNYIMHDSCSSCRIDGLHIFVNLILS
jgi:hypothetical protein